MLDRLHHVTLATSDLASSAASYERLFGRAADLETEGDRATSAWLPLGNAALELRVGETELPDIDRPVELGFAVSDLDAAEGWAHHHGLAPTRRGTAVALSPERTGGVPMALVLQTVPRPEGPFDPSSVYGLDHAVVRTTDGDAARSLYEQELGIRVALDRAFEKWGVRLIFCRIAGVTLELAAALGEDPASQGPPTRDTLWGFTWQIADADAARARLAESGFDVSEVRDGRKPGTRVFTVRDGTRGVPTLMIQPVEPREPRGTKR